MTARLDDIRPQIQPTRSEDRTPGGAQDGPEYLLGILGGLGPLASAEFLKTIYEHSSDGREQEWARVVLYSDPTFPDRTAAWLSGSEQPLLEQLVAALTQLRRLGASRIVICCVTMHHLLPVLPRELRARVVSLIDVVFDEVIASGEPHLLLCSTGAREMKIFERHDLWPRAAGLFVLTDEDDQREIHRMIYRIKRGQDVRREIPFVESLLDKYGVASFIAGCTEIHLLTKQFAANGATLNARRCLDPLTLIARELERWCPTRKEAVGAER